MIKLGLILLSIPLQNKQITLLFQYSSSSAGSIVRSSFSPVMRSYISSTSSLANSKCDYGS